MIGGVVLSQVQGGMASALASMEEVYVFDTTTTQWGVQPVKAPGNFPSTRTTHNAVVSKCAALRASACHSRRL